MKTLHPFILAALLLLVSFCAAAKNYFVDPSSAGANQGTYTDPWKSIADIPWYIDYFSPGDTVFFRRGQQYTGTLSINSSGSHSAPLVFMPYGSGTAPVFHYDLAHNTEPLVYNRMIIRLNQVNHVVIDGFELTDPAIPETNHNVTANVGYGVYIYKGPGDKGSFNTIKNCTISKLGSGVAIDGGSYNTITECTIRNLRMILNTPDIMWDDFGAMGIMVGGSNNTITRNHIQDCWSNSYDYHIDGGAIEMYGPVCNNQILYNTAIENLGWMEFGSGSGGQALNNVVAYNLLINNGHMLWINTEGVYKLDVRNLQLYNNNIIETHPSRMPDVRNMIGIAATPAGPNVITMKNNIFWIETPMNITDPATQPFNGPQLVHQNNLFHINGGSLGYSLDPSERQLAPGEQVFADITSSPDPAQWDYSLRMPCAAIDFGRHTGIEKDFYGKPVPGGHMPDAGITESITMLILPLEFLSCRGWPGANGNTIQWETSNEPVRHFEIEKSSGDAGFKTIATIPYQANSRQYQFVDKERTAGIDHYRIRAVELNNTGSYSRVISIKNNEQANAITLSPNPARDFIYLNIPGNDWQNKELVLVNMSGAVLKRVRLQQTGSQVKLDVGMLPSGAYVVKLTDTKSGTHYSAVFLK
jgi:hypothetical protein